MNLSTLFQNDITFTNLSKSNSKENKENWIHWLCTPLFLPFKTSKPKPTSNPTHQFMGLFFFFLNILMSYKYEALGRNLEGREVFPPFAMSMKTCSCFRVKQDFEKSHLQGKLLICPSQPPQQGSVEEGGGPRRS